ncbi:MAG: MCE family protein [Candidatus Omnitrophica bacterium]|nr:MCE family protein [Candidatus Omnitrophota bacterium]
MKINNETKIGILVVVVAVILFSMTWKAGDFQFSKEGYMIKVHFKNSDGVELNAPVTLNGLEVGRVEDIRILYGAETKVELTLCLGANAKVHRGAKAYVKNMGFLGEKYIGIITGDEQQGYFANGEIIQGQEPTSIENILQKGNVIAENLQEISEEGKVLAVNLREIAEGINERVKVNSSVVDATLRDLGSTMENLASISGNIDKRLDVNKRLVDDFVEQMNEAGKNLNESSQNLSEMSSDLKENPWKLLYRPKKK